MKLAKLDLNNAYRMVPVHSDDHCLRWCEEVFVDTVLPFCLRSAPKTEGPSCQLKFLGIQIDTTSMELSLPPDKPARISSTVCDWRGKKAATKRQLQYPQSCSHSSNFWSGFPEAHD